jgi:CHAT domain-containing protein
MELAEEALGFPATLLSEGVVGMIGTLWPVSDLSTALLLERFYHQWRAGLPPAQALWSAQRWLRTDPCYAHPYHWAGFVYYGR